MAICAPRAMATIWVMGADELNPFGKVTPTTQHVNSAAAGIRLTPSTSAYSSPRWSGRKRVEKKRQQDILFITLRRRSKSMLKKMEKIKQWKKARLDVPKRRHKAFRYYEKNVTLKNYQGLVWQIFVTGTGRSISGFSVACDMPVQA